MHSLDTGIAGYLDAASPASLTALRIAQNNERFAAAVRLAWSDSPQGADYLLAHVNSLYIGDDAQSNRAPDDVGAKLLGIYMDEPTARAELNSRRETLAFFSRQQGLGFSRILIHHSKGGMRQRFAYPEARQRMAELLGAASRTAAGAPGVRPSSLPDALQGRERAGSATRVQDAEDNSPAGLPIGHKIVGDQAELMEGLKRAICLTFRDYYQMQGLVAMFEGVYFEEAYRIDKDWGNKVATTSVGYYCHLFAPAHQVDAIKEVIASHCQTLACKCRDLGLSVRGFFVHPSPSALANHQAYPPDKAPQPLQPFEKRELAALRANSSSKPERASPPGATLSAAPSAFH